MLDFDIPINTLTEKPYDYPKPVSDLLFTLRALRAERGLPPVKSLGTPYSPHPNISHNSLQKQASYVGKRVVYTLTGVPYTTLHDVLRTLKTYYRGLHLDPSEVVCASGLSLRVGMPYVHGRLPKDPSVVFTYALAAGLNKRLSFALVDLPS